VLGLNRIVCRKCLGTLISLQAPSPGEVRYQKKKKREERKKKGRQGEGRRRAKEGEKEKKKKKKKRGRPKSNHRPGGEGKRGTLGELNQKRDPWKWKRGRGECEEEG